jgi:hypothetical protein
MHALHRVVAVANSGIGALLCINGVVCLCGWRGLREGQTSQGVKGLANRLGAMLMSCLCRVAVLCRIRALGCRKVTLAHV